MSENKRKADELLNDAYKKYYTDVYRFCMSMLTSDRVAIEDCVQEAFIVLYNKYLDGEEVLFVKALLLKTAKNFVLKHLRDNARIDSALSIDDIEELMCDSDDIDEKLTFEEYNRQISAALSERDALLFKLRYIDEYSLQEIAETLDISASVVGTRIFRLKKRLVTILEDILSPD